MPSWWLFRCPTWMAALWKRPSWRKGGGRQPTVALTAASMPDGIEQARAAGMDAFLGKPIDMAQLAAVLMRCLPAWGEAHP